MFAFANARLTVMTSTSSSSTRRMVRARSSMGLSLYHRPGEVKCRTAAWTRVDPGPAVLRFDDLADNREPDAGALELVTPLEGLEQAPDPLMKLRWDPDAVVGDRDLPHLLLALG